MMKDSDCNALVFNEAGLIPVVVQAADSKIVLMVAWMNRQALKLTLDTGDMWYWSRSRCKLWRKGETSGHTQRVIKLFMDCDQDCLLAMIDQTGYACHTGKLSCFYRQLETDSVID